MDPHAPPGCASSRPRVIPPYSPGAGSCRWAHCVAAMGEARVPNPTSPPKWRSWGPKTSGERNPASKLTPSAQTCGALGAGCPCTIVKVKVAQSCPTLCDPMGFSRPWNFPGQNTGVGSLSLLQGVFPTRDQTQASLIAGGSFTSWATGKPKDTGVGSLSLLQQIFPS